MMLSWIPLPLGRDPWLGALANGKDVVQSCGEGVANSILDVNDLEGSRMPLAVHDGTNTANVLPATDHDSVPSLELDMVKDLASRNVKADGIVGFDVWIWIPQCTTVMSHSIWSAFGYGQCS